MFKDQRARDVLWNHDLYFDKITSSNILGEIKELFPEKVEEILNTQGGDPKEDITKVIFGKCIKCSAILYMLL